MQQEFSASIEEDMDLDRGRLQYNFMDLILDVISRAQTQHQLVLYCNFLLMITVFIANTQLTYV